MTREYTLQTSQGEIFVKRWGEASVRAPVVLLHDSLGCVALWRDFPQALAEATGRRVFAYDRVGFGQSERRDGPLPISFVTDEATLLDEVLAALDLPECVLFGHSVGGGMAVAAAGAMTPRCVAVVTEAAQAVVEERTLAGIRNASHGFEQPGQLARLEKYHGDKARWVLDAWVVTWLSAAFQDWSLDAAAQQVRCPLLCLHGDNDEFGSVLHPQRIQAQSSGPVRVDILEGCGHVPHREQTDNVLALVAAFLAELD